MSILSARKEDKQMLVVILMDILALELMGGSFICWFWE